MLFGHHARTRALVLGLLSAALLVSGCAPDEPAAADITGVITSAESSGDAVSLRVVWTEQMGPRADFAFDALQASADSNLKVKDGSDEGTAPRTAADLEVGDIVSVVVDGPVAESYPPQGTADVITYLGRYEGELPEPPGLVPPPVP